MTPTPENQGTDESAEEKVLTLGEKLVGLNFNPSGDDKVGKVKQLFATLIDLIDAEEFSESNIKENIRRMAIDACVAAQMMVVKFITFKD